MPDAHKNFAYSTVAVAPSPDDSGTTLSLAAGAAYYFPVAPFNATVWATNSLSVFTNSEIIRVTTRPTTTIAAGSNGVSLPQSTINVATAGAFASGGGTCTVVTANGPQVVTYTGKGATTLTGCTGGTGAMSTGGSVVGDNLTITRAQETANGGPAARHIAIGDQISASITYKTLDDIEQVTKYISLGAQAGAAPTATQADEILIGGGTVGASSGSGLNIFIGKNASAGSSTTGTILIGPNASQNTSINHTNQIRIGLNQSFNGAATDGIAIGSSSFIGNTATSAIAIGKSSSANGGATSIAIGVSCTCNTTDSIAIGNTATVNSGVVKGIAIGYNATYSNAGDNGEGVAIGPNTSVLYQYGIAIGSSATSNMKSNVALGQNAYAGSAGQIAFGAGRFGANGDSIASIYLLHLQTTNATQTAMLPGNTASQHINLQNFHLMHVDGIVVARRSGTAEYAAYSVVFDAKRDSNAASTALIGTATITAIHESDASWDVAVAVDTTTGFIDIKVTGAAAKNINWFARLDATEVRTSS